MTFTALHRALGASPAPLTNELLDAAVTGGVVETNDLDWKSELPPAKGLPQTDFPKDVAAMANSGGGLLVYGVRESQKAATQRVDVGEFDEAYERSLRSAAITAISPPVFGLNVHRLGDEGKRAVVVEVPASIDGPHLVYKNDYFGAPVRNDSDTAWMKERQIEAMYRARFDERRHATEALDNLFAEAAGGRDTGKRAWLIAVAHPRVPRFHDRLTRDEARDVLSKTEELALTYAGRGGVHPLESVDRSNPRPGLRRWVAVNTATGERSTWKEAWLSIHPPRRLNHPRGRGRRAPHDERWLLRGVASAVGSDRMRHRGSQGADPRDRRGHRQRRVRRAGRNRVGRRTTSDDPDNGQLRLYLLRRLHPAAALHACRDHG